MKRFDGILLATDLDDTLLKADKSVSKKNIDALSYFMENGGLFTYATGRIYHGARLIYDYIKPNAPLICFNGAAIYDDKENEFKYLQTLDKSAIEVISYVDKNIPYAGIEISTKDKVYFCKRNKIVDEHQAFENLPDNDIGYLDIPDEMVKCIFMVNELKMPEFKEHLNSITFSKEYNFIQSSPYYYEILPHAISKGTALEKLKEITGAKVSIGVGDTENDIALVKNADFGVAVNNAIKEVKDSASFVTKNDNNNSAIAEIIELLINDKIEL